MFTLPIIQGAIASLLLGAAAAWPRPEPCKGVCYMHDPSLMRRADGKYFVFGSGGDKITLRTSSSLSGPWSNATSDGGADPTYFRDDNPAAVKARITMGAPDVSFFNGLYYMYYQHTQVGTQNTNISVAHSKTMEPGSWTVLGQVNMPKISGQNRLDPNLLIDAATGVHLVWGSYFNDIYNAKMTSPTAIDKSTITHLMYNSSVVTYRPGYLGAHPTEGAFQFKYGDYYYLFVSSGATGTTAPVDGGVWNVVPQGDEYKIMVCRSSSPSGPFVGKEGRNCATQDGGWWIQGSGYPDNSVYAPGGQGVYYDEGLKRYIIYYHYLERGSIPVARFGWNYLGFGAEGWPYLYACTTCSANEYAL